MLDIRNSDGRLVCQIDETTGAIEIIIKSCITRIERNTDGKFTIINAKKSA